MKTLRTHLPIALLMLLSMTSCQTLLTALATDTTYSTSSYSIAMDQARQQALFLSDKMAYELALTDEQYAAVYEINLDYLLQQDGESTILGTAWTRRNNDLYYVLSAAQYDYYQQYDYFYQPLYWSNHAYAYRIYSRYNDRNAYYYDQPSVYASYRGGHNRGNTSYYRDRFGYRNDYQQPAAYGRPSNGYNPNNAYNGYNNGYNNGNNRTNNHSQSTFGQQQSQGQSTTFGSQQRRPSNNTNSGSTSQQSRPSTTTGTQNPAPNTINGAFGTQRRPTINSTDSQNKVNRTNSGVTQKRNTATQATTTISAGSLQRSQQTSQQTSTQTPTNKQGTFGGHR